MKKELIILLSVVVGLIVCIGIIVNLTSQKADVKITELFVTSINETNMNLRLALENNEDVTVVLKVSINRCSCFNFDGSKRKYVELEPMTPNSKDTYILNLVNTNSINCTKEYVFKLQDVNMWDYEFLDQVTIREGVQID